MKANAIVRPVLIAIAVGIGSLLISDNALAQDVGADAGGGAGIFRPKNPEIKKRPARPTTPSTRTSSRANRRAAAAAANEDKIEELLDKGNQLRDARKFDEAEQAYQGVLTLKARDARAAYGLGNVYTDQRRWEDAETSYRNATEWNASDPSAWLALSVVLVQPRTGADNASRFAEAESAARRAVRLEPKNAVAWDRLGVALQARGVVNAETENAYRKAVELDPEFAVAYAHLARVLRILGKRDEAAPLNERAIGLAKDVGTLNLVAESLQAEQQWDRSEQVLRRALELDSRNPTALLLLGRMLIVVKRYNEAEGYLKTAVEVSPRAFQPHNLLGSAYLAMDRFQDAERVYTQALDLASSGDRQRLGGAFGFEGVGDGYMKNKQKSDAARAYQRAIELNPDNKALADKLSKARSR